MNRTELDDFTDWIEAIPPLAGPALAQVLQSMTDDQVRALNATLDDRIAELKQTRKVVARAGSYSVARP